MMDIVKRLSGKRAVVTGAGSGIGRAIACRLAAEGADVTLFELSESAGSETAGLIAGQGGVAKVSICDVADTESVRAAFSRLDEVDILVNNAGVASIGTVEQTSPDELDRVYRVNVKGVYHCLHFGIPKMLGRSGGAILNLASIASKIGIQDRFAYSMSKGAVLSMTLSVARDYVGRGLRCNCVCPARVHTPFVDGYLAKNYPDRKEEMFRRLSEYQPVGRMGTPEEIAALAAFLVSDEAAFITGAAYDIDGGVTSLR
jgi:NAD(P)-dependent dehydrogenase (short-subunit alcohol dehydrogenase family)